MFKRNYVSLAVAGAMLASSFSVAANTQKDDTTDSVRGWGPWAKQYATAAGGEINTSPPLVLGSFKNFNQERHFQNEPGIEQAESGVCGAGAFCGFTTIGSEEPYYMGMRVALAEPGDMYGETSEEVGRFDLQVDPGFFGDGSEGAYNYDGAIVHRSQVTGGFSVEGNDGYSHAVDGAEGWAEYSTLSESPRIDGGEGHLYRFSGGDEQKKPTEYNWVNYFGAQGDLATGVVGTWSHENWSEDQYISGRFIGGITTSLSELNSFVSNLNGTTANYRGITWDQARFGVEIDFGTNTWNAEFGGSINAPDGFTVTGGTVTGINFAANSGNLSAADGAVTGIVEGALFGSNAQTVSGMVDIEKQLTDGPTVARRTLFAGVEGNVDTD